VGSDRLKARQFTLWLLGAVVPAAVLVVAIINAAVLLRQAEQIGSLGALPDLLRGRTGTYWMAREALALVAGGLVWWVTRTARLVNDRLTAALLWAGLFTGLGGLLTMSLTSHAAAGIGSDWSVLSDFLHLTGVALWLGCLVQLPAVLSMGSGLSDTIRRRLQSSALRRFSILAACSVAIVLLSGTFNALVQIASPAALKDTAYGRTLLVKLAFVLPLLGIGLLNSVRIAARFERLSHRNDDQTEQQGRRLARVIVLESIAGAIVVAVRRRSRVPRSGEESGGICKRPAAGGGCRLVRIQPRDLRGRPANIAGRQSEPDRRQRVPRAARESRCGCGTTGSASLPVREGTDRRFRCHARPGGRIARALRRQRQQIWALVAAGRSASMCDAHSMMTSKAHSGSRFPAAPAPQPSTRPHTRRMELHRPRARPLCCLRRRSCLPSCAGALGFPRFRRGPWRWPRPRLLS